MARICDVVVVGGGPVGSRVSSEIARCGYNVLTLEQKPSLNLPVCCTGLISEECMQRFDLPHRLAVRSFTGATIHSPSRKTIQICRENIQAHFIDRPALLLELSRVAINNGVNYLFGHQVKHIQIKAGGVEVETERDNKKEIVKAQSAIMATGFDSTLFSQLGLRRGTDLTIGVQAETEIKSETGIEIYLGHAFAPGFFAWLVPSHQGRAYVGLMSKKSVKNHFVAFAEYLEQNDKINNLRKPQFRGITLGYPSKTYGHRLMLVGDCAGQVKGLTGGGLYFGLLCADIAARNMTAALNRRDLSCNSLSIYERDWRAILGNEIRIAHCARRVFGFLGDSQIDFMLGLLQRGTLAKKLTSSDIGFDWHGQAISQLWHSWR